LRIVIFITALLLFACGSYLSYLDKVGGSTVTYTAAIFCLIFSFLQEFKKFKGFGVEAELLEKKIEEADIVLKQIRDLSKPLSELLFTMVARAGRWGSAIPRKDSYRIMKQFESELQEIGLSEEEILKSKKEWYQFNLLDLSRPIVEFIHTKIMEKYQAQQNKIREFGSTIKAEDLEKHRKACEEAKKISEEQNRIRDTYKLDDKHKSYNNIINFLNSSFLINENEKKKILDEQKEQLRDLKYYTENHEFRRLEHWFNEKDN
jgi:hypothetical protein